MSKVNLDESNIELTSGPVGPSFREVKVDHGQVELTLAESESVCSLVGGRFQNEKLAELLRDRTSNRTEIDQRGWKLFEINPRKYRRYLVWSLTELII